MFFTFATEDISVVDSKESLGKSSTLDVGDGVVFVEIGLLSVELEA